MRLIAQCLIWNGSKFILPCILTIHKFVDEIQIFDGAYAHMKKIGIQVPQSTDGTKEIITALAPKLACPLKWIPCQDFWKNETAKRNFAWTPTYWHPEEWLFQFASDELLVGNIRENFERVRNEKKVFLGFIPMFEVRLKNGLPHLVKIDNKPRLWRWQEGVHIEGCHWNIRNAQGIYYREWDNIILEEMAFLHLKYLRKEETLKAQLNYESVQET